MFSFPAEAGDFDEEEHRGNYVSDIKLLPRQVDELSTQLSVIKRLLVNNKTASLFISRLFTNFCYEFV